MRVDGNFTLPFDSYTHRDEQNKKTSVEVLQRNVNSLYMVVRAYEEMEVQFHTFLMLPLLSTDQNKISGLEWTRAMLLVGGVNSHLPPILLADIFCLWWTVHAYE